MTRLLVFQSKLYSSNIASKVSATIEVGMLENQGSKVTFHHPSDMKAWVRLAKDVST